MSWLPIETAPKDGTEILGFWWNTDKNVTVGGAVKFPNFYVCWWGCHEWDVAGYDHAFLEAKPTHWLPIPEPPK